MRGEAAATHVSLRAWVVSFSTWLLIVVSLNVLTIAREEHQLHNVVVSSGKCEKKAALVKH